MDLSTYTLEVYFNGKTTAGCTINLSGILQNNDVYVIGYSQAAQAIKDVADIINGSFSFNGNDTIILKNNGEAVDSIGKLGEDPGSSWSNGDVKTEDRTLVRKNNIISGDSNPEDEFDPSIEWIAHPKNILIT